MTTPPLTTKEDDLHIRGRFLARLAERGLAGSMGFRIDTRRTIDGAERKRTELRREWEAEIRKETPSMRLCAAYRDREVALRDLILNLLDVMTMPRGAA